MASEARLNELLDVIQQARVEGDSATEAAVTAVFQKESRPYDPAQVENARRRLADLGQPISDMVLDEQVLPMLEEAERNQVEKQGSGPRALTRAVLGATTVPFVAGVADIADYVRGSIGLPELGLAEKSKQYTQVPATEGTRMIGEDLANRAGTVAANVPGLTRAKEAYRATDQAVTAAMPEPVRDAVANTTRLATDVASMFPLYKGGKMAEEATAATIARKEADLIKRNEQIRADIEKYGKPNVNDLADTMGFKLSAEDIELTDPSKRVGVGKGFLESIGGNATVRANQLHNRATGEGLLRSEFNIPEDVPMDRPFTEKVISDLLTPFNAAYEEVARVVQNVKFADEDIAKIISADDSASLLSGPAEVRNVINEILPAIRSGNVSGQQLLTTIRDLRDRARQLSVNATSEQATAGALRSKQAMVNLADALETRLLDEAARTGGRDLAMDLLNSRQRQAQLHSLQRSTTADHLDFKKLREELQLNPQMSGVMRAVAQMAEAAPKAFAEYGGEASGMMSFLMRGPRAIATKGFSELPHAIAQWQGQRSGSGGNLILGQKGQVGSYYRDPGAVWSEKEAIRRLNQRLQPPPGVAGIERHSGPMDPQEAFNFTEPTAVEAAGAPFEGAPTVNAQPNPAPRGLALASGRDRIPASVEPTRGRKLRLSVEAAKARADKLSLEGRMEVPDGRKTPSTDNLRLEGGPIEGKLPQTLEDLQQELTGRLLEAGWNPNEVRRALAPRLRGGGALSIPEGRVSGLQAPVDWEWKPDDVPIHVLPFDPTDKKALIKFLRGEK